MFAMAVFLGLAVTVSVAGQILSDALHCSHLENTPESLVGSRDKLLQLQEFL